MKKSKQENLTGLVSYVDYLGWCFFVTAESQYYVTKHGVKLRRAKELPRRYWLVDWSVVQHGDPGPDVQPGIWEAKSGDFTDRYHDDWVRPTKLIRTHQRGT